MENLFVSRSFGRGMGLIWGKILGGFFGFALGGPLGSIFGFIIGHLYDSRSIHTNADIPDQSGFGGTPQQVAFMTGIVVLGAKLAKVDGQVTRREIDAFKRVFNIAANQERAVGRLFDQARQSSDGFEPYAFQLATLFQNNPVVLEEILGGLFMVAASDQTGLSPIKLNFLKRVGIIFGFALEDFARVAARAGVRMPDAERLRNVDDDNYAVLGIKPSTDVDGIKSAYRALIREHHPDKLVAQGMSPAFIQTATEKMKRINAAYDAICKSRGIK